MGKLKWRLIERKTVKRVVMNLGWEGIGEMGVRGILFRKGNDVPPLLGTLSNDWLS